MKNSWKCGVALLFAGMVGGFAGQAVAAGEEVELKDVEWEHQGPFGKFDKAAVQRGLHVYEQICSACHSLKYLYYRNLMEIGFSEEEVKAIAAKYMVTDGPDELGDMFERPARPSDKFRSPYPNDEAARAANNGALPPDLTLIVEAREEHEEYIYSLLTGYEDAPADFEVSPGMNYNPYFANSQIAMPAPLFEGGVEYADGTEATVEQMAHDVVTFLAWAGEPMLEERKETGFKVLIFMAILSVLLWRSNKKIWKRVKSQNV